MRCYFMRGGRIRDVEFLDAPSDDLLIQQAMTALERRSNQHFDGFEVWHGKRFVYRYDRATGRGEKLEA